MCSALRSTLLAIALTSAPAFGQGASREATAALDAAQKALAAEDVERARGHAERASAAVDPAVRADAALVLAGIARATGDRDGMVRSARLFAEAAAGPDGRVAGLREAQEYLRLGGLDLDLGPLFQGLVLARVRAVDELIDAAAVRERRAGRDPEQLLTASWLRRAALDLATPLPRVLDAKRDALDPGVHVPVNAHVPVLEALERIARSALTRGRPGLATEAARVMKGLGVQADFKALRGPRPSGLAKWRARGAELLDDARDRARAEEERPWTVDELEWLASDEGQAFTRQHDTFASPGIAVSPRGWYRIESDCGYEALLATASTIEGHHERLARHFGEDPFVQGDEVVRQGIVRIVPDPSGLEAEGAPFFWAGGFQAGDTTVVRLTAGTVEGLGRGLTHELTHRFDGVLHPGIPAWLTEGRAVWTGAAYGPVDAREFVSNFAAGGTLLGVLYDGLANAGRLERLVSGEPDDYRDNYSGGNALYVYLSTWFPGEGSDLGDGVPIFASRLAEFEDSKDHGGRPKERFARFQATFCDGKDGRPKSFDAFAEGFRAFLAGFDPREPAPFRARYGGVEHGGSTWIYDEPTWTWDWERAEPRFGQVQARRAAELLAREGRSEEALLAYVWARAVDGYDPRTARGTAELLAAGKPDATAREAAFAVRRERRGEPFARSIGQTDDGAFPAKLPATAAYAAALADAAGEIDAGGARAAAAEIVQELERLRAYTGAEGSSPALASSASARRAFELRGWREEELTRMDEDRPPALFSIRPDGEILLGRRDVRENSSRIDRRGGGVSFVRSDLWLTPGVYEVRTRVRFTTGFNQLVCVLGYQTRDRNTRLFVSAGDVDFANGETDEEPTFTAVRWGFDGMRPRDRGLPGAARSGLHDLGRSSTAVELVLRVEGPMVEVWFDGRRAGVYHAVDGQPFEGYVGFGTRSGAISLSQPVVTRTDGTPLRVLDLARGSGPDFEDLDNATVLLGDGVEPPPNGALLLWTPSWSKGVPEKGKRDDADANLDRMRRTVEDLLARMERNGVPQPLFVAVAEGALASEEGQAIAAQLADAYPGRVRMVAHSGRRPDAAQEERFDGGRRWLMFVDAYGIARTVGPWRSVDAIDDGALAHWLTVFRDHGRPERDLPEPAR